MRFAGASRSCTREFLSERRGRQHNYWITSRDQPKHRYTYETGRAEGRKYARNHNQFLMHGLHSSLSERASVHRERLMIN
jgi:hypothetical protein